MLVETDQKDKPRQRAIDRSFIEDGLQLTIGMFGKKATVPMAKGSSGNLIGKKGVFIVEGKKYDVNVSYRFNLNTRPYQIELNYRRANEPGIDGLYEQTIRIDCRELKFGHMFHFLCPSCSRCCNTLFINPYQKSFYWGCRKCKELDYSLCYINKNTQHGKIFYLENRRENILRKFPDYKRLFYKGQLTRKLQKFANLYARSGLDAPDSLKQLIGLDLVLTTIGSESSCND